MHLSATMARFRAPLNQDLVEEHDYSDDRPSPRCSWMAHRVESENPDGIAIGQHLSLQTSGWRTRNDPER